MMKKILKLRFMLPKYIVTYNPDAVLTYISTPPTTPGCCYSRFQRN